MRKVKDLRGGGSVIFGKGKFDDYCVYVVKGNKKFAPHDETYFADLQIINNFMGCNKVFEDFLKIYDLTWAVVEKSTLFLIEEISDSYPGHFRDLVEMWFTVIYSGMIAEEMKQGARLRKKIKKLGMFQTLVQNRTPQYSAKFSYGKDWVTLEKIMKELGI